MPSGSNFLYYRNLADIRRTIAEVTGMSQDAVQSFAKHLRGVRIPEPEATTVWNWFRDEIKGDYSLQGAVYFHGTRRFLDDDFSEGLQPNNLAVELIWNRLWSLIDQKDSFPSPERLREAWMSDSKRVHDYWERIKGERLRERGPWGKLVREEWFKPEHISNHYRHKGSELVRIIIKGINDICGRDVSSRYIKATKSCLVHFKCYDDSPKQIGYGLLYLRDHGFLEVDPRGGEYGLVSMEGRTVPRCDIIQIEDLE